MDFDLTEEQEIFREELRKFLEAEIRPLDDRYGDEEMTADRARELCKKLIPWGYMGGGGDRWASSGRHRDGLAASRARSWRGPSPRWAGSPA